MIVEAQRARTWRLRSRADAARISAARAAASDAGLLESGSSAEDGRLDDVLARVLLDLGTLMALTGMILFPVNGGAGLGAPGAGELKGAHRRVSSDKAVSQAAYALARRAAAEVLSTGIYETVASAGAFPARQERQEEKAS